MRIFILLSILPILSFAQSKKTIFLESGSTGYISFTKNIHDKQHTSYDCVGDFNSDLTYTYKTTPGFYIKTSLEIGQNPAKRFNVTFPLSLGYKEFKTEIIKSGTAYGCFYMFNGTEVTRTSATYGSLMAGPKFNFNFKDFTVFGALNTNVDLFLSGSDQVTYNDLSSEKHSDFKIKAMKGEDISVNSGLQLGLDYRVTERLQIGLSAEAYFARLNTMMNTKGSYIFNFNNDKRRSTMILCGAKLGYSF